MEEKLAGSDSPQCANSSAELDSAISMANALSSGDSLIVEIQSDLLLTEDITPINTQGSVTIQPSSPGNPVSIDGAQKYCGFVVVSGSVTLIGLNIKNTVSQGQSSCMGAGGGLLVANLQNAGYKVAGGAASVTLINVTFEGCEALGGGGVLAAGGEGGYGDEEAQDGSGGYNPSGSLLGTSTSAGYFGVGGPGGKGGKRGKGTHHNGDGHEGDSGNPGGNGGYGGGAGGGGGGGGGRSGQDGNGVSTEGASGGDGGNAGAGGAPGFGGGSEVSTAAGQGEPPGTEKIVGGPGGNGGSCTSGGGAGLGGAIFVMENASLCIQGSGSISGGSAQGGGGDASGAGAGIFLQGSGFLTFIPQDGPYTVSDPIVDEKGAVASGLASACNDAAVGPDKLPTGGGGGCWGIEASGAGTLVLDGSHAFYGPIRVIQGALDLSSYTNPCGNDIAVNRGAQIIVRPQNGGASLNIGLLQADQATLALNGYSQITVQTLQATTLSLLLDSAGFVAGTEVTLIKTNQQMSPVPTVKVPTGYSAISSANEIAVTLNSSTS